VVVEEEEAGEPAAGEGVDNGEGASGI